MAPGAAKGDEDAEDLSSKINNLDSRLQRSGRRPRSTDYARILSTRLNSYEYIQLGMYYLQLRLRRIAHFEGRRRRAEPEGPNFKPFSMRGCRWACRSWAATRRT
jgi:hypothetical protein